MKSRSPAMKAATREASLRVHVVRADLLRAVPLRAASLRGDLLRRFLSKAVFLRMAWLLPVLAILSSCSLDNEFAPPVPNAAPDTRVNGQTPEPLESGFLVHLSWGGSDADGEVIGYQFKLRPIGNDGISYRDTLTIDPGSGAMLNPWQFTAAAESLFVLTPRDLTADTKLTQAYVFLVRAVDNAGGVDPTPAYVCFTASTLLPSIMVDRPPFYPYYDAQPMPPTVRFGFTGVDPDFHSGMPTKIRFLWKRALVDNNYIRTQYEYQLYYDELTSFADSNWSFWIPYNPDPEQRVITFPNTPSYDDQDRQITYIFAIQAMDTTGAVSVDRLYGYNIQNVYVTEGLTPQLTVYEFSLGTVRGTGVNTVVAYDIAAQQPLNFSWVASAEPYFGTIDAYRYGWDVADPEDENDPGWAVTPGISPAHRYAPERSFNSGSHTLTVQCWDDSDQLTRITYMLNVVPIPDPASQYPLLLVDDVLDHASQAWVSSDGLTPLDNDIYRDAFWVETLAGTGGVHDFVTGRDVIDTEEAELELRDLVNYRVVLFTTRFAVGNFIWNTFKPLPTGQQPFNWLESYQHQAGNVFLAGARAMNAFLEDKRWMIPWVFDTDEEYLACGGQIYAVGFGQEELPDGTVVNRGLQRYPYRAMGLALLDHVTPRYNVYALCGTGSISSGARNAACVGNKGLAIDPDFAASHMPGGVFPDTIFTDATIDWRDSDPSYYNELNSFIWGSDEFYDGNITTRTTPWSPQDCGGVPCVEPMFRIHSRFDWVDLLHEADGDPEWPHNVFDIEQLRDKCGQVGLDDTFDNALTEGHVVGYIAHKYDDTHSSGVGDVVWGFDPYRFDHTHIKSAIQWVLGEHFGLAMGP